MKHNFMILLVILGVCSFAHSLRCYTCHSDEHKDCGDTSTNEEMECVKENDSCSKIHINGKITKGCVGIPNKPAGCKRKEVGNDENQDAFVEHCLCHGDYCNSAGTYKIYPILIASLILAPLLS